MRLFLVEPGHAPREILARFLAGGDWHYPAWHPDGRLTIAGRHRTEGNGIYTVSVEDERWVKSSIPDALRAASKIAKVWVLSWAPDGRFLYATCDSGNVANLWRFHVDTSLRITSLDRMTAGPGADWSPTVSRDGKILVFTVITGLSRLWSFPFKTKAGEAAGTSQPLSEEDGDVNWASLSPDGRKLAYFYSHWDASELRLMTFPFTAPPERVPSDRYKRMASAWSHHGDRLALEAAEFSNTGAATNNLLIIREPGGTERVVGECRGSLEAPCSLVPVAWTPDDSAILVTSRLGDDHHSRLTLWSATVQEPAQTPTQTLVADKEWNVSQGAYSPDGRWLAFAFGGESSRRERHCAGFSGRRERAHGVASNRSGIRAGRQSAVVT